MRERLLHGTSVNTIQNRFRIDASGILAEPAPLHGAAWGGHDDIVLLLLDHGADVNALDQLLWSPLHAASANGHESTVRLLLQHGASPIYVNTIGRTAIHVAMAAGHESIAKYLLSLDQAFATLTDAEGYNCLHYAAMYGCDLVIKVLLEVGLDIEALPTPPADSDYIFGTPLVLASKNGHTGAARALLDRGANVHAVCIKDRKSALQMAVRYDHLSTVELLLERGANVEYRDAEGTTALIHASAYGCKSIKNLLDANADIDAYDENGDTALHLACNKGRESAVEQLLTSGAQNLKCNYGALPLHHAVECFGAEFIVRLLLQHFPGSAMERNGNGLTTLHIAAIKRDLSITKLLLLNEPRLLEEVDDSDQTALFSAVGSGSKEIVEFLLEHGSHLTLRDMDGRAPWDFLDSKVPEKEMIDLLVSYGWVVDERYSKGRTAFHVSVLDGNEVAARSLISRGCNIEIGDDDGDTPLDTAIMKGNSNMQTLIRDALEARKSIALGPTIPELGLSKTDSSGHKDPSERLYQLTIFDSPETIAPPENSSQTVHQESA